MRGTQRLLSKNRDTFKVDVIEFKMILKLIFILKNNTAPFFDSLKVFILFLGVKYVC